MSKQDFLENIALETGLQLLQKADEKNIQVSEKAFEFLITDPGHDGWEFAYTITQKPWNGFKMKTTLGGLSVYWASEYFWCKTFPDWAKAYTDEQYEFMQLLFRQLSPISPVLIHRMRTALKLATN